MSGRLFMNQQSHSSTGDLVVSALEAMSGALRALEVMSASLADHKGAAERKRKEEVDTAIDLIRAAIAEIRQGGDDEFHPGATGFVMAVRRRRRRRRP